MTAVRNLDAERPPRTTFYYRDQRRLVGDNRNYGIARARGRYIVCLDSDDELEPGYLEVALFLAEVHHYDIVYPSVQCFGESDEQWLVQDASFEELLQANTISTVALFRRSAWLEAGGYRDWGVGDTYVFEDWAFWTRLVGMGYRPKAIRQPLMRHRVRAGSLSSTSLSTLAQHREAIRAANDDLLDTVAANASRSWGDGPVDNAYSNLFAREPSVVAGGSILMATSGGSAEDPQQIVAALGRSLADDGVRVIVTLSESDAEAVPRAIAPLLQGTDHAYELPRLFEERSRQKAFLLYLLQRYDVRTLVLIGCQLARESLPAIRRLRPDMGIVDLLFDSTSGMGRKDLASPVDLTIVPSSELRTRWAGEATTPSEVVVIPPAVPAIDIETHDAAPPSGGGARPAPTIGFFGHWSEGEAPGFFMDILRTVAAESKASFLVTGDGPMRDEVQRMIDAYDLGDRVRSPGVDPGTVVRVTEADIVACPFRDDELPWVVLVAMALGKPVVAAAVGAIPEIIEDGRTGFLCRPGDVAAFTARITELLNDEGLRVRMGKAARHAYAQREPWNRVYRRYRDAFARASTLAAGRPAQRPTKEHGAPEPAARSGAILEGGQRPVVGAPHR